MEYADGAHLRLRRLGIDTYRGFVVFVHRDCLAWRSEGFQARSRVRDHSRGPQHHGSALGGRRCDSGGGGSQPLGGGLAGDRTTMIVVPIIAAAGLCVRKSRRGQ